MMIKKILIVLIGLVVAGDVLLTLWGQPLEYWSGGVTTTEQNPIGEFLLSRHPAYFVIFTIAWLIFLILMIKWLRFPLDIVFGSGIIIGHFDALMGWVRNIFQIAPFGQLMVQSLTSLTATLIFITIIAVSNIFLKKMKKK